MKKKKKEKETVFDMPGMFLIIGLGLLISVSFIVFGALNSKGGEEASDVEGVVVNEKTNTEEQLGQLFEEEFKTGNVEFGDDVYSINDPYREECASTAGDDLPAISGYTVCLR